MKKWQLAALSGITISAAATAAYFISRKGESSEKVSEKGSPSGSIKNPRQAEYSFVTGYNNAETVKVAFTYDEERFSYKVTEEEFLTYTDNAHVGALYGEEFNLQLEYTDFISGENFEKHCDYLSEKYKGFKKLQYSSNCGCMYYDGDSTCFVFPASDYSCVLISVLINKGSKLRQEDIDSQEDITAMLSSLAVSK